jgi:hypothetical protein
LSPYAMAMIYFPKKNVLSKTYCKRKQILQGEPNNIIPYFQREFWRTITYHLLPK